MAPTHTSPDPHPTTGFEPLSNYGLIGNLETCALVSRRGSVDWFPIPHLESPSVFARILDGDGGQFRVQPVDDFESTAGPEANSATTRRRSVISAC